MSQKKRILTEPDQAEGATAEPREETAKKPLGRTLSEARERLGRPGWEDDDDPDKNGEEDESGPDQDDACDPVEFNASGGEAPGQSQAAYDRAKVTVRQGKDHARVEAGLSEWEEEVRADAKANGGVVPPWVTNRSEYTAVRLKNANTDVPPPSDTETLLNGLIAECRFLMHEVTFNSARLTYDPKDRIQFLSSAESMAITATKVADAIGRLRQADAPPPAPAAPQERRQRITVEHIQTVARPQRGEGGRVDSAESENQ